MKKNQPLNIQRRQLLAQLPHYVAAGAATYIGLNGGLGAQIAGASEQSLTLVPASGSLPDLTLMGDTGEKRLSALAEHNLPICRNRAYQSRLNLFVKFRHGIEQISY